jgi:hypothetical protein
MAQLTKEHWVFGSPVFMVVINLVFAGNIIYTAHMPKWYAAFLCVVILYFIANVAYLVSRTKHRRANGLASVPKTAKNTLQTVAGMCVLMTAMAFVAMTFFTDDHVPVPFVKLYFLAIFVSAVLFIIGGRSPQRSEERPTFS